MRRFVSVRLAPHELDVQQDTVAALSLRISSGGRHYDVLARVGPADRGADEHFAVDADACRERRWAEYADVLHAGRPRSPADAARWLVSVTAAHPACRVVAAPLAGGGWAVADGTRMLLVRHVPATRPLLASCLHAWLVAGLALRDIEDIRVLDGGSTTP
ncbi:MULTISPECIES: hypothetical protein [Streptomyces]|uniref:Uncharacterized protein n=1 Tax=Streptomyces chartreusis NRRL 3882 TaxID=1079985 RepID=A0A2N9B2K8_STRCX|nr:MULTISPECIES: hypothetical protein [Streptomyces]MYS93060.1 hypothetical protein [Streptomyces sp. SID5464]SOR77583.1 hypothetical protein SCNRRL3882_1055 [Streptomyces chartreusis NRRL 3882]